MKEKLAKVINVKSIITILLTIVFSYLSISGYIHLDRFMPIFTVIISFYFGMKTEKNNNNSKDDNNNSNNNNNSKDSN